MGDRANIYLEVPKSYGPEAERGGIYLYTHWKGHRWPEALRLALEFGRERWDDDIYLARIITTRVFADLTDTTGGGLSLVISDNSYPIIIADLVNQTVSFAEEGEEATPALRYGTRTFAEFVGQRAAHYPPK
jgi:hypothetical protein